MSECSDLRQSLALHQHTQTGSKALLFRIIRCMSRTSISRSGWRSSSKNATTRNKKGTIHSIIESIALHTVLQASSGKCQVSQRAHTTRPSCAATHHPFCQTRSRLIVHLREPRAQHLHTQSTFEIRSMHNLQAAETALTSLDAFTPEAVTTTKATRMRGGSMRKARAPLQGEGGCVCWSLRLRVRQSRVTGCYLRTRAPSSTL